MSNEDVSSLPVIREMPIVDAETWRALREEMGRGDVEDYFLGKIGGEFVKANPAQREVYESVLRDAEPRETDDLGVPKDPDLTSATVLTVWRVLNMQARKNGYQLPQLPSAINPLPALREFIPRASGSELRLMDIAYRELLRAEPRYRRNY